MQSEQEKKRYAAKVVRRMAREYPDAECSLNFRSTLQLLVATILSAQCTDKRVNVVTKDLFRKYRSTAAFAKATQEQLEDDIRSTGFFRNKAKSIRGCCQALLDDHRGKVPEDLDSLVRLPGVGRKTANVILGTGFGIASGIVVDTHVGRISRRLALTAQKDAVKVERDLNAVIPKKHWIALSHRMIQLGRSYCTARKPKCDECPLAPICPRVGVEST